MIVARISGTAGDPVNPLAGLLLTEVIDKANAAAPTSHRMTTGAAYNIWPTQADFQHDLVLHVLDLAPTSGTEKMRAVTMDGLSRKLSWRAVLGSAIEADFAEALAEPAVLVRIGLGALVTPEELANPSYAASMRYLAETGDIVAATVRYSGRRLRSERSMDDLVEAIAALGVGYVLRARTAPGIPKRPDAEGISALAAAAVGIVEAFTEDAGPAEREATSDPDGMSIELV
jgi:hypothetical protein